MGTEMRMEAIRQSIAPKSASFLGLHLLAFGKVGEEITHRSPLFFGEVLKQFEELKA